MTAFDYAAGLLLLVSGLFGFARGATHEITTVLALVAAAILSVAALRFTGPLALHAIHTPWLATAAAVLLTFILVYAVLRLIGGALTRGVKQTSLSGLDRLLGFGVGLVRALVAMGGFILLIDAATPPERMPAWITGAKLYPLASAASGALRTFAPQGLKVAHDVAPAIIAGPASQARRTRDDP
ncbi:MAG TPA: CvpA family protein [Caulobacteraceae bacterium]|nr:CvpA family protein [Caulobacteraceae bacterium]